MKKVAFIFISLLFFSCSKEKNNETKYNSKNFIQFKLNGKLKRYDLANPDVGDAILVQWNVRGIERYELYAHNISSADAMRLNIFSKSLQIKNYHTDTLFNPSIVESYVVDGNNRAILLFKGDYFDLNITSYKKDSRVNPYNIRDTINGTFTAKLTPYNKDNYPDYSKRGSWIITEGIISNLEVDVSP